MSAFIYMYICILSVPSTPFHPKYSQLKPHFAQINAQSHCGRKLPLPHALSPRCHAHYAALRCATNNLKLYSRPASPHSFSLSLSVGRQRLKIVYYLILFAQFPTNNMLTCWCSHSNNNNNSNYDNNNNKDKNRIGKCCCGNKMKQDSNNKNNSNTDNDRGL